MPRARFAPRLAAVIVSILSAAAWGGTTSSGDGDCPRRRAPADPDGESARAESISIPGGPEVDAVVYPRPDYEGELWSQWGQGLALRNGRFVSAIGDHSGPDGNSYLFMYDAKERRLTRFDDVLSHVDHDDGDWGYGKIHGAIVPGPCRDAYFATYWGTDDGIEYGGTYRGDYLFRLDTTSLEVEALDVPVPEHGIPSLASARGGDLVYGEAVTPTQDDAAGSYRGSFFAYDPVARDVVFESDADDLSGFRSVLVGDDGTAYLSGAGDQLLAYEPGADALEPHEERLPGRRLRAATVPAGDGTVYGVTENPPRLFAFRPDGAVEELGAVRGYTASLALHPDGDRLFYVPGARGDAWEQGTPVIAVDTETGEETVIAELNDAVGKELGLTLNGSYNIAVDPGGDRLYVGLNAGRGRSDPWGEVVLVVVPL